MSKDQKPVMDVACEHFEVQCLNEHELVRKYRCRGCNEIMMCNCDEIRGRKFLPHQLEVGCELYTQKRVPVSLGFQPKICNECKGLPLVAAPAASTPGRTSKIVRYYWREISFLEFELFAQLEPERDFDVCDWAFAPKDVTRRIHAAAVNQIKTLHASNPRYTYFNESQEEIIKKYSVEILNFKAKHTHIEGEKRVFVLDHEEAISVETYVARHFQRKGYLVLETESAPFHVLFGVFFAVLIGDPDDQETRIEYFGDREAYESGSPGSQLAIVKPSDFGTAGYGERRKAEIQTHLDELPDSHEELLWLFDYWLEVSFSLRNYLWAHREEHVATARKILELLPLEATKGILRYLIDNYWNRYCGWPDLFLWRQGDFRFVEVKSSNDKLSDDQKNWIRGNSEHLNFRFSIAKIHRI